MTDAEKKKVASAKKVLQDKIAKLNEELKKKNDTIKVMASDNRELIDKIGPMEKKIAGSHKLMVAKDDKIKKLTEAGIFLDDFKNGKADIPINKTNLIPILDAVLAFANSRVSDVRYPGGEKHLGRIVSMLTVMKDEFKKFYNKYKK